MRLVSQSASYKAEIQSCPGQLRLRIFRNELRGAHSKHLWYSSLSACINVYHLICLKGMLLYKQGPVCTSVFLKHLTWEELCLVGLGTERKCSIAAVNSHILAFLRWRKRKKQPGTSWKKALSSLTAIQIYNVHCSYFDVSSRYPSSYQGVILVCFAASLSNQSS